MDLGLPAVLFAYARSYVIPVRRIRGTTLSTKSSFMTRMAIIAAQATLFPSTQGCKTDLVLLLFHHMTYPSKKPPTHATYARFFLTTYAKCLRKPTPRSRIAYANSKAVPFLYKSFHNQKKHCSNTINTIKNQWGRFCGGYYIIT